MTPLLIVTGSVTGAYFLEANVGLVDYIVKMIPIENATLLMFLNAVLFGLVAGLIFILLNQLV